MPVDSDREEGEIVDDYDFIISSDEENVRQRMQELEDKNYELEQIARISGVYSYDYNNLPTKSYHPQGYYDTYDSNRSVQQLNIQKRKTVHFNVPSNVSSISSEEHSPIPIRRKRNRSHAKSRYHKSWREHRRKEKRYREENYHKNHSSHHSLTVRNYETECEQNLKHLREQINKKLQNISFNKNDEENNSDDIVSVNSDDLDMAVAGEENTTADKPKTLRERLESRNIQSTTSKQQAVGHNEEETIHKITSDDSMSMDEQELRLIALKSAVLNKHMARKKRDAELAYSPTDFNEFLNNDDVYYADEGNVELDMTDLTVGMDISPALSPISSSDVEIMEPTVNTRPVDMDIAMSDSDVVEVISPTPQFINNKKHNENFIYHEHTTDMNYIEMEEATLQQTPPPPPPPLLSSPSFLPNTPSQPVSHDINNELSQNSQLTDDEEEERALRALLLAKFQYKEKMEQNKLNDTSQIEEHGQTPTESILKQAVARLRNKSQSPIVVNAVNTDNLPNIIRAPLKIRSVSTINNDYVKIQQSMVNAKNPAFEPIVSETIDDSTYNANALRDISCNENIQTNNVNTTIPCTATNDSNIRVTDASATVMLKENTANTNIPNLNTLTNINETRLTVLTNGDTSEPAAAKIPVPRKNATMPTRMTSQSKKNNLISLALELKRKSLATLQAVSAKRVKAVKTPARIMTTRSMTNAKSVQLLKSSRSSTNNALNSTSNHNMDIGAPVGTSSSRLITVMPKVQVPKLIITFSADSSDESDSYLNNNGYGITNRHYVQYDNASPISLSMDSPAGDPSSRCSSPVTFNNKDSVNNIAKPNTASSNANVNDCFQQQLDEFLKDMRTKNSTSKAACNSSSIATKATSTTAIRAPEGSTKTSNGQQLLKTSKAVRHLPESSQREYRSLMQRMIMLEKIKQQKSLNKQVALPKTTSTTSSEATSETITPGTIGKNTTTFVSANNKTLIRKVLVTNSTNTAATFKANDKYTYKTQIHKEISQTTAHENNETDAVSNKRIILQAYERSYEKNGIVILSKINHSLEKLKEAREAKIQKLRYSKIMKDLKTQLRTAQIKYTQAHSNMNKVFPSISATTQIISTLKRRRTKLSSAASEIGTQIIGENYRLKNEDQAIIIAKSEELALRIEEINKISSRNIDAWCTSGHNLKSSRQRTIATRDSSTMTDEMGMHCIQTINITSKHGQELHEIDTETSSSISTPNVEESKTRSTAVEKDDSAKMDVERKEENKNHIEEITLKSYVSPLNYANKLSDSTDIDANAIICPFGLLGVCRDSSCKFVHL